MIGSNRSPMPRPVGAAQVPVSGVGCDHPSFWAPVETGAAWVFGQLAEHGKRATQVCPIGVVTNIAIHSVASAHIQSSGDTRYQYFGGRPSEPRSSDCVLCAYPPQAFSTSLTALTTSAIVIASDPNSHTEGSDTPRATLTMVNKSEIVTTPLPSQSPKHTGGVARVLIGVTVVLSLRVAVGVTSTIHAHPSSVDKQLPETPPRLQGRPSQLSSHGFGVAVGLGMSGPINLPNAIGPPPTGTVVMIAPFVASTTVIRFGDVATYSSAPSGVSARPLGSPLSATIFRILFALASIIETVRVAAFAA
jgi:hypothetical protein